MVMSWYSLVISLLQTLCADAHNQPSNDFLTKKDHLSGYEDEASPVDSSTPCQS